MEKIEKVSISEIKLNPTNPRIIKDEKFHKLVQSIKEFPQMLGIRPIVVDEEMIVLGGNMRFKACKEAGLKEVPVIVVNGLTEEQKKEFVIKDNANFGDWDWEVLQSEWDMNLLPEWGIDVFELPNDVDYSILDQLGDDDDDDDDLESLLDKKTESNKKSILLPFGNEKEYTEFMKIIQQWVREGRDPGHEVLTKIKG